ncbi:MAG TPA: hypothetical protein VK993_04145 [Chthoniobacterales bacterium]|nr:hypothetical protein [Chthoniobacterales bacterium]
MPDLVPFRVVAALAAAVSLVLGSCGKVEPRKFATDLTRLAPCEYDKPISFGSGGEGERLMLTGWSPPEPYFTWSDGIAASLAIRLPPTDDVVQLHFKMAGMNVAKRLPFQRVDLFVNSQKLARWQVADENVFTVTVPDRFVSGPDALLVVDFYMPKSASPDQLGIGSDRRRLGVRLAELNISSRPRPAATGDAGQ